MPRMDNAHFSHLMLVRRLGYQLLNKLINRNRLSLIHISTLIKYLEPGSNRHDIATIGV